MDRTLRYSGMVVLAVAVWLLVAGELDWISSGIADEAFRPTLLAGLALWCVGLLLGLLGPLRRRLEGGRCVRCGKRTERGQTYCIDHLRATLNEYQDQMR